MFLRTMDAAFEAYTRWIPAMEAHFRARYPKAPEDSAGVYKSVIRAKALDTLRGLLPAATTSNVGLFGTGQAFEALLLRMAGHPLAEVRGHGEAMLVELRRVIPAFLERVDQPARGGRWSEYFAQTRDEFERSTRPVLAGLDAQSSAEVALTDFDPDGEAKVIAAALYPVSDLPDVELSAFVPRLSAGDRAGPLHPHTGPARHR